MYALLFVCYVLSWVSRVGQNEYKKFKFSTKLIKVYIMQRAFNDISMSTTIQADTSSLEDASSIAVPSAND